MWYTMSSSAPSAADIQKEIDALSNRSSVNQTHLTDKFKSIWPEIMKLTNHDDIETTLCSLVDVLVNEDMSVVTSRQQLSELVKSV